MNLQVVLSRSELLLMRAHGGRWVLQLWEEPSTTTCLRCSSWRLQALLVSSQFLPVLVAAQGTSSAW